MGARAVVAEREAASADDGFPSANARDRRRAGPGDHEPAVRAGMGADASGHGVIRGADKPVARKRVHDRRRVARLLDSREPEANRDSRLISARKPRIVHDVADDRAQDGDRGGAIDMDIRRRPARLRERPALGVPQPRPASGRAAVDPDIERPADRPIVAQSSTIAAAAALERLGRVHRRERRNARRSRASARGVAGRWTKTARIGRPSPLRCRSAPK